MFPLSDDRIDAKSRPVMTWLLVLINVLVFVYQLQLNPQQDYDFSFRFGAVPAYISHGQGFIGLITSLFLHGGWFHLIGNMVFLWIFGDNIEAAFGHLGYLAFYFAGGIVATLAHVMSIPDAAVPLIGASGAISAIMGAYIVMFPRSSIRTLAVVFIIRVPAFVFLIIWFLTQIWSVMGTQNPSGGGGTAYWAHIGGFVYGLVLGFIFRGKAKDIGYVVRG